MTLRIDFKRIGTSDTLAISFNNKSRIIDLRQLGVDAKKMSLLANCFKFVNEHVFTAFSWQRNEDIYNRLIACLTVFDNYVEFADIKSNLIQATAHMFAAVDFNIIERIILTSPEVRLPDNIQVSFEAATTPGTAEQTYLLKDYRDILTLACGLKLMIPIWIKFDSLLATSLGRGYKEKHQYSMLSCSAIMRLPAVKKMSTYVDHYVGESSKKDAELNSSVSGSGWFEVPEMVISKLITTLVPYADPSSATAIRSDTDTIDDLGSSKRSLLSQLYFSVTQAIASGPKRITGVVSAKFPLTWGGDGDNTNYAEEYRATKPYTTGDVEFVDVFCNGPTSLLEHSLSGLIEVNKEHHELMGIFLRELEEKQDNKPIKLQNCQITLAFWFTGKTHWREYALLPIYSRDVARHTTVNNVVAAAQTYLWVTNQQKLAALIGATPSFGNHVNTEGGRERIKDEKILDALDKTFSAALHQKNKRRRDASPSTTENRIISAIDQIVQPSGDSPQIGLASCVWKVNLPSHMREIVTGHDQVHTLTCPRDVRSMIALYLLGMYR